ncbi:hypothetical protein [Mycobacterium sp. M26]|uniref:hypothetical protein n=1 Tax=Mycobacterium sp. M26 TaxID=1762962 RepID=UPI0009E6A9D1|nr:hypothetical protein [Mycobacterium sp. M26]
MGKPAFAVALVAVCALLTAGTASADNEYNEYAGQTYADASQAIQRAGGTDTIATVVGDQLPTTQCRVTGSRSASFLDSSGNNPGGRVLLDLNCNADLASPGNPGNSVSSPQGQRTMEDQQAQQQAEAQQNQGDELLQSGEVPGVPGQIP